MSGGANAIDGGVVVSLEKMTAIREVNPQRQYAVAEAGVLNADLGRAAASAGMFYPPDPGSLEICTIGGNLATNAGGMRCVKYGVTKDCALALEVVLADGTIVETGSGARKDVAGYDLVSLFVGSEGTLGVITSATLRLRPAPRFGPVTFAASFPSLEALGAAVDTIHASGVTPSLLELIDNATINAIEDYRRMGNLHPVLLLPDLAPQTTARALAAGERICARALELGGTITGEHGAGVPKKGWLRQQLSPAALAVHRAIKAALDPGNILNPGRAF